MTDFSTHEVAKALGLPDSKLRSCARAAQLAPTRDAHGRLRWSFEDLLLLKTTRGLLDAKVPARRIRSAARQPSSQPTSLPLRRRQPDAGSCSVRTPEVGVEAFGTATARRSASGSFAMMSPAPAAVAVA